MNNGKDKKKNKKGGIIWLVILAVYMFFSAVDGTYIDWEEIIGIVGMGIVIIVLVLTLIKFFKKYKEQINGTVMKNPESGEGTKKPISCANHSGKERYIYQLDEFLKNGIIERREYNIMRRKYESMNIADDYH